MSPSQAKPTPSAHKRPPVAVLGLVAVVVLLAIVAIVVASGGDDDDGGGTDVASESPQPTLGIAPVAIEGDPLPRFDRDATDDPAVGMEMPRIQGSTPVGRAAVLGAAQDRTSPTVIAVVAHQCPHCQAEVPRLVDLWNAGGLPEGARFMALATNSMENAPNYPPGEWLDREGWPGEVVLDDEARSGADALGTPGYPFLVVIDGEGRVVGRLSGERQEDRLVELLEEAAAATPA
jgi:hypothetical protein